MKKLLLILTALIPVKKTRQKVRKSIKENLNNSNNRIITDASNNTFPKKIEGLKIKIKGKNNTIKIDPNVKFANTNINIQSNNSQIIIKSAKYIKGTNIQIYNGDNQLLEIGNQTTIESSRFFLCATDSKCIIGDDCMLSSELELWTGDGHQIIDNKTGKIVNDKPTSLEIDNHCWIGFGAKLLKNSKIHENSIVAKEAIVTKNFNKKNIIIAGNPAKVVKEDINWNRADPFTKEEV